MNKKEITLKRISYEGISTQEDHVAIEQTVIISNQDGQIIEITCSPGSQEEMLLGRKITAGEIAYEVSDADSLKSFDIKTLLDMAEKSIDTPEELFNSTGCAHSCMLANSNKILCHMEDIKRHNALDKAIGYAAINNISLNSVIIFTSGRVSLDYLEKVINAGVGIIASRAAVTDAAIELAKKTDTTLLGFVRNGRANLYHEGRVKLTQEEK